MMITFSGAFVCSITIIRVFCELYIDFFNQSEDLKGKFPQFAVSDPKLCKFLICHIRKIRLYRPRHSVVGHKKIYLLIRLFPDLIQQIERVARARLVS